MVEKGTIASAPGCRQEAAEPIASTGGPETTPSGVEMLPDQEPRDTGGVFAPFFGVSAYTMTLISKLAKKTNAAVFFAYMQRLPEGKGYRLIIEPAATGIDSDDELIAATALNRSIETCVRACPEQYLWAYRRFKQRPEGEKPVY